MLRLDLRAPAARPLRLLAIGCHADDIEIGCGGTVLRLLEENPGAEVTWVVLSADGPREAEARSAAEELLAGAGARSLRFGGFRDGFLPWSGAAPKEFFEEVRREVEPDVVLTHARSDLHQDHRLACELTWNTFRDHLVLEYEIPKYDGDLGSPNAFVALTSELARRKVALILRHFASQAGKGWFTEDLFLGLMRVRGMEAGLPGGHAEAFYARKVVL